MSSVIWPFVSVVSRGAKDGHARGWSDTIGSKQHSTAKGTTHRWLLAFFEQRQPTWFLTHLRLLDLHHLEEIKVGVSRMEDFLARSSHEIILEFIEDSHTVETNPCRSYLVLSIKLRSFTLFCLREHVPDQFSCIVCFRWKMRGLCQRMMNPWSPRGWPSRHRTTLPRGPTTTTSHRAGDELGDRFWSVSCSLAHETWRASARCNVVCPSYNRIYLFIMSRREMWCFVLLTIMITITYGRAVTLWCVSSLKRLSLKGIILDYFVCKQDNLTWAILFLRNSCTLWQTPTPKHLNISDLLITCPCVATETK